MPASRENAAGVESHESLPDRRPFLSSLTGITGGFGGRHRVVRVGMPIRIVPVSALGTRLNRKHAA
jgi:hypothetical protein